MDVFHYVVYVHSCTTFAVHINTAVAMQRSFSTLGLEAVCAMISCGALVL